MPFTPTALSWWGWLLCALALLLLSRLAWESSDEHEAAGCGAAAFLLLLALLTGGIGLVQFVKWAWAG